MGFQDLAFLVFKRDDDDDSGTGSKNQDTGQEILDLLSDPFSAQLNVSALISALAISLSVTVVISLLFSFLRPYHQAIYAPRVKHADERHAPPPIGKAPWSWLTTVIKVNEDSLIELVGMDATIFLRFTRMCRNMFLVLSVIGCAVLIPLNLSNSAVESDWLHNITPLNVWASATWGQVIVAWVFDIVIAGFLWWNYRKITFLRRKYFETTEYQKSLHSRTLMLYDLPKQACSDEGIARIIDEVAPSSSFARTAVARNVKDLPALISEHDRTVRKLEKVLAKYLRNPGQLPAGRPTCRPSKKDRSFDTYPKDQKLDAIEYLTQRIRDLEVEVKEVRASVDKRSTMPYGFASYADIVEAHNLAYALRKKKPHGATITLAPRPNDVIWENMPLSKAARSRRRWVNALWVILLTVLWIVPNTFIAVFLVNLSNLGKVWDDFEKSLENNTTLWGIVQGIASPALTSLFFLFLPVFFRRLSVRGGDQTKTGRERHVLAKLFSFFVFNNLVIFSIFSTVWAYVAGVVQKTTDWKDFDKVVEGLFSSLCLNSFFWVTYLLQRQLGAAVDLSQAWPLVVAFCKKRFSSPTPRELIELTAPPPFEYASYYNYFLFYVAVTLCFAGINPLVLPATALYFSIDSYLKKYLLLYVFVTKTESGGVFWRVLFNRFIFGVVLANLVTLLTVWCRGDGQHLQLWATVPLPVLMIAFKFYCSHAFDNKIRFYSTRNIAKHPENGMQKENRTRSERLASRFGHPALYKPLITPMVHARAQNLLPSVYKGRLTDGREGGNPSDLMSVSGYSDMYALDAMQGGKPGKTAGGVPGFEYVSESHMDFGYYKNRMEFAEDHGGGEIYGRPGEIVRPETPGSFGEGSEFYMSRPGTPGSGVSTPFAPGQPRRMMTGGSDMSYSTYRPPPPVGHNFARQMTRDQSPNAAARVPLYSQDNSSSSGLIRNAAGPAMATPSGMHSREVSLERGGRMTPVQTPPVMALPAGQTMNALGGGPQGYSGLAQSDEVDVGDPAQYDYFRGGGGRSRRPGEGW